MANIGDIYIPTISELSSKNAKKESQVVTGLGTDHIYAVEGRKVDVSPITIKGFLFQATGDPKTADDYAEDLMALEERDSVFNYINTDDTIGFLSNISVSIPKDYKPSNIRKYEIKGSFFPYSVYQHGLNYGGSRYDNGTYYAFPRYFALPSGSVNVHLASSIDVIPLSSVGSIGTVPIYRPFPFFDHSNYDSSTGSADTDSEAMDGNTMEFDTNGENIIWTINIGVTIPRGIYKVKFRSKGTSAVEDIQLDVVGSISGSLISTKFTCTTDFIIHESSAISCNTHEVLTITLTKLSETNTVVFDYLHLNPEYTPIVLYDTVSEYNSGEVKLYDTVTHGNAVSSTWKRIYSLRHKFTGDILVMNNLMSWRINTSVTWANTGDFIVNGNTKKLYPGNFSAKRPNIVVVDISPTYIEFMFKDIDTDQMKTTVIIDPLMFRFEVEKTDSFADDWKFTTSGVKFSKWNCTSSAVGDYTFITSSNTSYMFALLSQTGYTTVTYNELLFEAFNKPNITGYIAKRMN